MYITRRGDHRSEGPHYVNVLESIKMFSKGYGNAPSYQHREDQSYHIFISILVLDFSFKIVFLKWILVLCSSLITNNVVHFLCIFFSINYLFVSSAHFSIGLSHFLLMCGRTHMSHTPYGPWVIHITSLLPVMWPV